MKFLLFCLAAALAYGQTPLPLTPTFDVRLYNWTRSASGNLSSSGSGKVITVIPSPAGVVYSPDYATYVRIIDGTPESALITATTCPLGGGTVSCTITVTTSLGHAGAFTVGSATAGFQEAINIVPSSGARILVPPGTFLLYARVYVNKPITIEGSGITSTVVQGQTASVGLFQAVDTVHFRDLQLMSILPQTFGAYGVKLDAVGGGTNYFSTFDHVRFVSTYDAILATKACEFTVTNSIFTDFTHTGITAGNVNQPDCGGPTVTSNNFANFSLGTPALAAFLITSTGGIRFANNGLNGSATQLNYGVDLDSLFSTGLLIENNDFENMAISGVRMAGTYYLINISNNHFSQFGGIGNPDQYWGILAVDGSGTGIQAGTITGNVMLGLGPTSHNTAIALQDSAANWSVTGNQLWGFGQGLYAASTTSGVVFGTNQITNGGTTVADLVGFASVTFLFSSPTTFAKMLTWHDGSMVYCSDCTVANPCAGSGTGALAKRLNGAWVCN